MLSLVLKLIVLQPNLLVTHFKNYSSLLVAEGSKALMTWRRKMLLLVVSAVFFTLSLFSFSISVLLWAALPSLNQSNAWLMLAFPALLLIVSVLLFHFANRYNSAQFIQTIHQQIQMDKKMICELLQNNTR